MSVRAGRVNLAACAARAPAHATGDGEPGHAGPFDANAGGKFPRTPDPCRNARPAQQSVVADRSPATPPAPAAPVDAERQARRDAARQWTTPKFDEPKPEHYNRLGLDFRRPMDRPTVAGRVIDCHSHLLAAHHADEWFEAADHFGIDHTITMSPLEECIKLVRGPYADRMTLIAVPAWEPGGYDEDNFWPRVKAYRDLGCRVVKFHLAPGTMQKSNLFLGTDRLRGYMDRARDLGMIIMTHIGDPQAWYDSPDRYGGDPEFWGTRDDQYDAWERLLEHTRGHPWWGAHLGGWPENLPRLQHLLDTYPDLMLDLSATKWIVRALAADPAAARDFVIRNADRLMWGSDQVSQDGRGYDFYASRWWSHRTLFETSYEGESPIADPDAPGGIPMIKGLSLPEDVLQKLYRDNVLRLLGRVGVTIA